MNFLNSASYLKHMNPENNYLEDLKAQGIIDSDGEVSNNVDLSDEIVEAEIEPNDDEPINSLPLEVIEKKPLGRNGTPNIPDFLKRTIAAVSHTTDATQANIADAFGVSKQTVSLAHRGKGSYNLPDDVTKPVVDKIVEEKKTSREKIEDLALLKTLSTLNILTDDDIECLGAKDKADVAVKLSKVASNMRDKVVNNDNRSMLIINAPPVRTNLDNYPMIEVG